MNITPSLLQQFVRGDIRLFYTDVFPSLLLFAEGRLGVDYAYVAEDTVQNAIFNAYVKREQFQHPWQLKSYLYTCIHNEIVSFLRKRNSRTKYMETADTEDDNLQASIIEQETLDMLYDAIDKLPERLRRIFELSFEQGLSNTEAAKELGLSVSAVKKQKSQLVSELRKHVHIMIWI